MREYITPREHQVLERLLEGDSPDEISKRLKIKEKTVKTYMTTIYRVYQVKSRAKLMAKLLKRRTKDGAA